LKNLNILKDKSLSFKNTILTPAGVAEIGAKVIVLGSFRFALFPSSDLN
jgi:hypothetical protein